MKEVLYIKSILNSYFFKDGNIYYELFNVIRHFGPGSMAGDFESF